jgi:hypothetical protein
MHLFGVRVGYLEEVFIKCTPLLNLLPYFGCLALEGGARGLFAPRDHPLYGSTQIARAVPCTAGGAPQACRVSQPAPLLARFLKSLESRCELAPNKKAQQITLSPPPKIVTAPQIASPKPALGSSAVGRVPGHGRQVERVASKLESSCLRVTTRRGSRHGYK